MRNDYILEIKDLSHTGERNISIKDIFISIKRGEKIVMFGIEESGIDLICPIIANLIEDFEGDIVYNGRSIKTFDYLERHYYRRRLGYVQRGYGLINNMTVEENISLPLQYHSRYSSKDIEEIADGYMQNMSLNGCRDKRPVDLLRSEMLKTAFVRSIVMDPALVLFEHPLEGQCLFNNQDFIKSFSNGFFSHDISALFITYQPEYFADFTDRYIMLYDGEIVFDGSKEEFKASDNSYLIQFLNSSSNGPMKI